MPTRPKTWCALFILLCLVGVLHVPVPVQAAPGDVQFIWSQSGLAGRFAAATAFDDATGTAVLFGGGEGDGGVALGDTWTWDGSTWTEQDPAHSPRPRLDASMAYDAATDEVVLFGGYTGDADCPCGSLGDTWTWDGSDWTQRFVTSPGTDRGAAMSYDPVHQEIVLFHGYPENFQSNTWTWDGSDWTLRSPTQEPPGRTGFAMAFDPTAGNIVLFGGQSWDDGTAMGDTWTWDGSDWTEHHPASSPSARAGATMASDPTSGTTLFGGCLDHLAFLVGGDCSSDSTFSAETWTWDGSDWTEQNPADAPAARFLSPATYDSIRDEILIFGGGDWSGKGPTTLMGDTWAWNGSNWVLRMPAQSPPARFGSSMVYDESRRQVVVFGGVNMSRLGDTWTWDGSDWTEEHPLSSPAARDDASVAYDSSHQETVLFGGERQDDLGADTWTWDGSDWTHESPIDSPPKRVGGSMAFDAATGTAVLFGGQGACAEVGLCDDTWTWDGNTWTEQQPAHSPPEGGPYPMSYDPIHQQVVLLAGDTWTWNGSDWTEQQPAQSLPAGGSMAFDPATGTLIFVGLGETWSWDGINWTQLFPEVSPPSRIMASLAFDANANGLLFQGWDTDPGVGSSSWNYGVSPDVATSVGPGGGTVSTSGPLEPDHPLGISIQVGTTPNGGRINIARTAATHEAPKGYAFLDQQVWIIAPGAGPGSSHSIGFQLDPSLFAGTLGGSVSLFLTDSALPQRVTPCSTVSPPDPDPCISDQHTTQDGVVHITVSATSGPIWNFALPGVGRSVTIGYSEKRHAFRGKIASKKSACVAGQRVTIYRVKAGTDKKVGSDRTSSSGAYQLRDARPNGKYYATVPDQQESPVGICEATTSKTIRA